MLEGARQSQNDATGDVFLDAEILKRLKSGTNVAQVSAALLVGLSRMMDGVQQGLVVLSSAGRARFQPVAIWPEGSTAARELMIAVDGAVKSGRTVIETVTSDDGGVAIATPVAIEGRLRGSLAILLGPSAEGNVRLAIDQLQWASGWIEALIRRRRLSDSANLVTVIELLATSLHHQRFQEAATAVATELAGALGCERVSIGFLQGHHCRVRALSNSAAFGKKANLIRAIEAAMDEAVDQQASVVYPAEEGGPDQVLRAHAALARGQGLPAICTVPLTEGERVTGALLLERGEGESFDTASVQLIEHAAVLLGPVLDVKRREDRWLPAKAVDALGNFLRAVFGPDHAALKLGVVLFLAFVGFCVFATGTYRVTADAVVEGRVQRAVTAPLAGYLAEAEVRAGDVVSDGQVMARLDDRDLRLERLKWVSQRAKHLREYSEAVAKRERTRARILQSQIEQTDAQLALLDQQLVRMTVLAPFDGIVISGDLTQALGAPLERGDVLFEVAPLDDYRVMLRVDERDIADLKPGQGGDLMLSALPDAPLRVVVERITPISNAEEGLNFFMVEASVAGGHVAQLRPGMEGVSKIEIDERRMVWIWTRKIILWARMALWSWWP